MDLREQLADELETARRRSLDLLAPVSEADLVRQHSPLMSPLIWDLAHVGVYEEIWLLRQIAGAEPIAPRYDAVYDPFKNPRSTRGRLDMMGPSQARSFVDLVRGRALDVLERIELDPEQRLLADGFVYGMVVQHEHQHDETMLATLQLREGEPYPTAVAPAPSGVAVPRGEVLVEGGEVTLGTDLEPWAYDNERPAHTVHVEPFLIDVAPVTNEEYAAFVEAGGYDDRRFWAPEGWAWRVETGASAPQFWAREGEGSWSVSRFGHRIPLAPSEPVQHVCWYEADAFARWAGRRLPTEAEWETAASWRDGRKTRFPWGDDAPTAQRANLGQRHLGPAPAGAYPDGVSPWGCHQMIGDVWEWTSSSFTPYPGFESFPYREYSEVFYGSDYKVLRGGSWATHPAAIRATFRNWDYPVRRQIFSGFRCARDA